ncbi:MAG: heme lyase CcmF/NrfE family subunit [Micropepsaceae bacterium]
MIAEIGHFSLVLAFALALVQGTVPLYGAAKLNARLMAVSHHAAIAQLVFLTASFLCLAAVFVLSDFTVRLVAEYSHSDKPLVYKIAGVWGNHEGSMLLWVLILGIFGAAVALFGRRLPPTLSARTLAIQGLIGAMFLAFILFTSNPFLRLDPAPVNGNGLNPLLQDPGLATHPPFLYMGYVGFSMAFSFAIAALIEGKVEPAWARWVRPWTLAAWCFLTMGIMLGSVWAYYELGWGGWWFWDPVENASLMPWLAGTALIHSAIVVEKRDALKRWTILLSILTFSLSLVGTFMVRSGVITSVHSFAVDPTRGIFILGILVITTGGALTLYALRASDLKAATAFSPVSRETSLVLNNVFLVSITAGVFFGTFYSLFARETFGTDVSVGAPMYNIFFVPLMLLLMLFMAVGPVLAWKRGNLRAALFRLRASAAIGLGVLVAAVALSQAIWVYVPLGIAAWLFASSFTTIFERTFSSSGASSAWQRLSNIPRATYGTTLAHVGIAITAAGIAVSAYGSTEVVVKLKPGQSLSLADYELKLASVVDDKGPNYTTKLARFEVRVGGQQIDELVAEHRNYPNPGSETTEAGIRPGIAGVLYVTLGRRYDDGNWAVRAYYHPLIMWIWAGCVVMVMGGTLSLSDRRLRVGAPIRSSAAATPQPS